MVEITLRRDDMIELVVEDTGPGIPDHELRTLDEVSARPLSHGSGVGLWLAKWVIEGANAQIDFTTSSAGTTVRVTFPRPDAVAADDVSILRALEG